MDFVWFILIGFAAGWLAGKLMKGSGFGILGDIVVGVVGALLGGFIFGLLGISARRWADRELDRRHHWGRCPLVPAPGWSNPGYEDACRPRSGNARASPLRMAAPLSTGPIEGGMRWPALANT